MHFPATRYIRTAVGSVAVGALALTGGLQPLLFSASAQDTAFTTGEAVSVSTDALNLRTEATSTSPILIVLPQARFGTIVSGPVTADAVDWYEIDVDGVDGFVAGEFLVDAASVTFAADETVVVNTAALNLRAEASPSADIVDTLILGTAATIVSGPTTVDGTDWYEVDVAGTTGFVARDYLAYGVDTAAANTTASSSEDIATDVVSGDELLVNTDLINVRDTASISGTVLETVAFGETVTATGTYTTAEGYTWAQIQTSTGTTGFVVADYLTADSTDLLLTVGAVATVDTDALNLRGSASLLGESLATLDSGATVTVISASEAADGYLWYQVESDLGTGWVAGIYLIV